MTRSLLLACLLLRAAVPASADTTLLMPPIDLAARNADPYIQAIKRTVTPGCSTGRMQRPSDARWRKYYEGPTELGRFKAGQYLPPDGRSPRAMSSEEAHYYRWMQLLAGLALTPGVPMDVSMYAACVFKRQMAKEWQIQDDQEIAADSLEDAYENMQYGAYWIEKLSLAGGIASGAAAVVEAASALGPGLFIAVRVGTGQMALVGATAATVPIEASQAAAIAALAGLSIPLPDAMLTRGARGGGGRPGGGTLRRAKTDPKILRHIEEDEGFSADTLAKGENGELDRAQGIKGAHDRNVFLRAVERLKKQGRVVKVDEFQYPEAPGLSKMVYQIANSEGKVKLCVKTVFDPKRFSSAKWLDWGFKAYENALKRGAVTSRGWIGEVRIPSGAVLKFQGYFGPDGAMTTLFAVL